MTAVRRGVIWCMACAGAVVLDAHAAAEAPQPHPPASPDNVHEAQQRFRRGVDLYGEGDLAGASAELTHAYKLAPNFKILFNLGQIAYEREDYAAALDDFTRYLADGGEEVPPARRLAIAGDLTQLRQRIGYVGIQIAKPGCDVIIDDVVRGATPLKTAVPTNAGRHRVELVDPAGDREARVVDLEEGQTIWLSFTRPVPELDETGAATAWAARKHRGAHQDDAGPSRTPGAARHRIAPWVAWGLTAICAGSAAVTGALALNASFDLQRKLESYPVSSRELDATRSDQHTLALTTDALLLGTAVLSAVSLSLTFSGGEETSGTGRHHAAITETRF